MSSSSSFLIAFISVYKPLPTGKPYFLSAILFHLASECTISASLWRYGTSKLTGVSTPFKLSFVPVSGKTNNGDDTLVSFNISPNLLSKKSFKSLIACWVSITLKLFLYSFGITKHIILYSLFLNFNIL